MNRQFNPKKLDKLNNPARLEMIPPEYIWKKLDPARHTNMVEIGAGTGLFSKAFQTLSGEGKTFAIDVSEIMVEWMQQNVVPENPDIIPLKTDGTSLPFQDETVDLVFTITVHHELENPTGLLTEANRIMRPGGKIFIVDWNMNDPDHGPSTDIRCSPEQVSRQLESAGFHNITIDNGLENFFIVFAEK